MLPLVKTPIFAPKAPPRSVIVTEWDAFRALDLARIKDALSEPIIVDLRNIYSPSDMRKMGFHYFSFRCRHADLFARSCAMRAARRVSRSRRAASSTLSYRRRT